MIFLYFIWKILQLKSLINFDNNNSFKLNLSNNFNNIIGLNAKF